LKKEREYYRAAEKQGQEWSRESKTASSARVYDRRVEPS
jgi:hypothetical protein